METREGVENHVKSNPLPARPSVQRPRTYLQGFIEGAMLGDVRFPRGVARALATPAADHLVRRQPPTTRRVDDAMTTTREDATMDGTATAVWRGGLTVGKGELDAASGVLTAAPYSFETRFEGAAGTNREELVAAAHAGCYAMALAMILGEQGFTPERIDAEARLGLEGQEGGFAITNSHLTVRAEVPGVDAGAFAKAVETAKSGCPVSKALTAAITLDSRLAE